MKAKPENRTQDSRFTSRQLEIMGQALSIIDLKGIQAFTTKNLAAALGLSEGAIYRHFKSKTEIFEALLLHFEEISSDLTATLQNSELSVPGRLRTFFMTRLEQFSLKPGLAMLMFANDLFPSQGNLEALVHRVIHGHGRLVLELMLQGQTCKEIRNDVPAQHLTVMIMGSMRLLLTRWRSENFSFDLPQQGNQLWNSLEKMITD